MLLLQARRAVLVTREELARFDDGNPYQVTLRGGATHVAKVCVFGENFTLAPVIRTVGWQDERVPTAEDVERVQPVTLPFDPA